MSEALERFGRAPSGSSTLLCRMDDGYWTPWHIAQAEIERLRGDISQLNALLRVRTDSKWLAEDEVESLRAENEALRKDAERYRWLRGDAPAESERWPRWNLQRWDGHCWNSLERGALDAAIDAALAAKER